ncbi:glycosyltransferase family 1 protein [Halorubrum sp. Atlit-8R]|nr:MULTISPECIES: glycosyltransferase family 4 protein [unclassified Halorubrum]RLM71601.1 glycosyltransferase family 1 protein [Halorubrum sp. Atlit-9R]RLM82244.1 glycosyltransferase family 1 protein [Halorubrum sp. Atlit-8R]
MSKKLSILVVSDAYWPEQTGGITKSLLTEIEGLVQNGHKVVVVTRTLSTNSARRESRGEYLIYRYRSPNEDSPLYHAYPLASIGLLPRLVDKLDEQQNFDIAYVHNIFQSVGVERASASIPQVYNYHAPISREINIHLERGKYGWKAPIIRIANNGFEWLERRVVSTADMLLARSRFMSQELSRVHDSDRNPNIVPLAVDTDRFAFEDDPTKAQTELGLPTDRPIFLTVRRLVARVGLEMLVDAMKIISEQYSDALLLIGGEGYLRSSLEQRVRDHGIEDQVEMLGFIPEEDLPTYYAAADFSVMPTKELEGFGLSTIESLSCGTPVIGTPVGANPEVIGPLNEQLLCANASSDAIAEQMGMWAKRGGSSELRTECRNYCEENFSSEKVVESLTQLFRDTISDATT